MIRGIQESRLTSSTQIVVASDSFDKPFADGTFTNLNNSCLYYNQTSDEYVDAKTAVLEAKKRSAGTSRVSAINLFFTIFVVAISVFVA